MPNAERAEGREPASAVCRCGVAYGHLANHLPSCAACVQAAPAHTTDSVDQDECSRIGNHDSPYAVLRECRSALALAIADESGLDDAHGAALIRDIDAVLDCPDCPRPTAPAPATEPEIDRLMAQWSGRPLNDDEAIANPTATVPPAASPPEGTETGGAEPQIGSWAWADLVLDRDAWKQRAEWAEQSAHTRWQQLDEMNAELAALRARVAADRELLAQQFGFTLLPEGMGVRPAAGSSVTAAEFDALMALPPVGVPRA
jgi:hypothetical protein